jgi:predicted RNA methylase
MTQNTDRNVEPGDLELGQYIPLHYHFNMLVDEARTGAFVEAIDTVVRPGGRVVDLGAGTGILSFRAAQRAARVWAVERNPELVAAAARLLEANGAADVEVVAADARDWLPPEPVDVVVCEMLHVGLLREKQVEVIDSFAQRYLERHGPPLPRFLPEATIQAVQPVHQDFEFHGYRAPVPFFQDGNALQLRTTSLGEPVVYHTLVYGNDLSREIAWTGDLPITTSGELNALRFITKNLLAILPTQGRSIDWLMNYLIVPLETPVSVAAGDAPKVSFAYEAGAPLTDLAPLVHGKASRELDTTA